MDKVFITDLEVLTIIGVYDWEKYNHQRLLVSLEVEWNIQSAAAEDNINKALNYAELSDHIHIFASKNHFQLVETFAERLAMYIHELYSISWIKMRVNKVSAVNKTKGVGVEIERSW